MKYKDLKYVRRIVQIFAIVSIILVLPWFLFFLVDPNILIPEYSYDKYSLLYINYSILFCFLFIIIIVTNAGVKRYYNLKKKEV